MSGSIQHQCTEISLYNRPFHTEPILNRSVYKHWIMVRFFFHFSWNVLMKTNSIEKSLKSQVVELITFDYIV